MSFRRHEEPQLQEEEPQSGGSELSDRNGTRREETLSDLPPASELHYNTVEYDDNDDDDEDYSLDQVRRFYAAVDDVHGGRRRLREQTTDEEAPPMRRHRMEEEAEEFELTNLDWSSSPNWSLSPILECSPNIDVHFSSEHFWGRRRRREQITDEEDNDEKAPSSRRQRVEEEDDQHEVFELTNLERSSSPYWSVSPTLEMIADDSSSGEHFWWMWTKRRREQMSIEEDTGEEAPSRRQDVDEEEDDSDVFDLAELESILFSSWSLTPTSDFMPIVDDSSSTEHFWWLWRSQYVDSDEETPVYENMPLQNSEVGVPYVLLVFVRIFVIVLDQAGIFSISILSIPIIFLVITVY